MGNSCHISLYGVHRQCLRLELQEIKNVLHSFGNRILTPLTTPASEALPSAVVHLSRGVTGGSQDCSDSCIRKAFVLEGTPLSFHAMNWRVSRSVWYSTPLSGRHCNRRSHLCGRRRGISHIIWRRRWYQYLLGQREAMTMASTSSTLILIRDLSRRGMGG